MIHPPSGGHFLGARLRSTVTILHRRWHAQRFPWHLSWTARWLSSDASPKRLTCRNKLTSTFSSETYPYTNAYFNPVNVCVWSDTPDRSSPIIRNDKVHPNISMVTFYFQSHFIIRKHVARLIEPKESKWQSNFLRKVYVMCVRERWIWYVPSKTIKYYDINIDPNDEPIQFIRHEQLSKLFMRIQSTFDHQYSDCDHHIHVDHIRDFHANRNRCQWLREKINDWCIIASTKARSSIERYWPVYRLSFYQKFHWVSLSILPPPLSFSLYNISIAILPPSVSLFMFWLLGHSSS